jgi:hypothetical protein
MQRAAKVFEEPKVYDAAWRMNDRVTGQPQKTLQSLGLYLKLFRLHQ